MPRLPRASQLKLQASRREAAYRTRVWTRSPRSESYLPVSFIQIVPAPLAAASFPIISPSGRMMLVLYALVFCLLTSRACIIARPQCNGSRARRSFSFDSFQPFERLERVPVRTFLYHQLRRYSALRRHRACRKGFYAGCTPNISVTQRLQLRAFHDPLYYPTTFIPPLLPCLRSPLTLCRNRRASQPFMVPHQALLAQEASSGSLTWVFVEYAGDL